MIEEIIHTLIQFYQGVILAAVVMSWLIAFGVVNIQNPFAAKIWYFLTSLTEPVFKQVRRIIPAIGGLDLSPLIVLFGLSLLDSRVGYLLSILRF